MMCAYVASTHAVRCDSLAHACESLAAHRPRCAPPERRAASRTPPKFVTVCEPRQSLPRALCAPGLVTPVLRNVQNMSWADIEKEIALLGGKARKNALTVEDLAGGTFSITNGGVFGSLHATQCDRTRHAAGAWQRRLGVGVGSPWRAAGRRGIERAGSAVMLVKWGIARSRPLSSPRLLGALPWCQALDPDHQHPAVGHPRHARYLPATGGGQRAGRDPTDDVHRSHLRPQAHRRQGSRDFPQAGQGAH